MATCEACGSLIELRTAQTRSADEARTIIYSCSKCPLDVSRFSQQRKIPHIYLPRQSYNNSMVQNLDNVEYRNCYYVEHDVEFDKEQHKYDPMQAQYYYANGEDKDVFKCYVIGPKKGLALRRVSKQQIGPGTHIVSYRCAKIKDRFVDERVKAEYYVRDGFNITVDINRHYVEYRLCSNSTSNICECLLLLYISGFPPSNISQCLETSQLSALSNLTSRSYDDSSMCNSDTIYSVKADGVRLWLIRIGYVWMAVNRLRSYYCEYWYIDTSSTENCTDSIGPCIDIEYMYLFNPILIDVLMLQDGVLSPQDRNIKWIYQQYYKLLSVYSYLGNIHLREFRQTPEEAEADRVKCGYPTDGVVAIHKDTTDMVKLKSIKSMELMVDQDMCFITADGVKLIQIEGTCPYEVNTIVELRFSIASQKMFVVSHFARTDKTIANGTDAVRSIIQAALPRQSMDILRTYLWRWSNNLRSFVYATAFNMSSDKSIMIDIGTGAGQSTDLFSIWKGKSIIMIEPDTKKCQKLANRIGIRYSNIKTDARSIIPIIPRLRRGEIRYHLLNMTLQEFLKDDVVIDNLKSLVGCCIGSFSAHYVLDCIELLRNMECPFIGTCYVYDNIAIGQSIIKSSGIEMTRVSQNRARVKWGTDEEYYEPVVESSAAPTILRCMNASSHVPYSSQDRSDPGYIAASSVKMFVSY